MKIEKNFVKGFVFLVGIAFAAVAVPAYGDFVNFTHGDVTPVTMTAAELAANGLGSNGHVRLVNFRTDNIVFNRGGRYTDPSTQADIIPTDPADTFKYELRYCNNESATPSTGQNLTECEGYVYKHGDQFVIYDTPTVTLDYLLPRLAGLACLAALFSAGIMYWMRTPDDESSRLE